MESTNEKKQWEVAEIQLSYKSFKPSKRPKISGSRDETSSQTETLNLNLTKRKIGGSEYIKLKKY